MSLTPVQLQHKREHKADLRRRKHALIAYLHSLGEYAPPSDCYDDPEPVVSPAPPSVTASSHKRGFFGTLADNARRIWNRKV